MLPTFTISAGVVAWLMMFSADVPNIRPDPARAFAAMAMLPEMT
jgi:hypothetical protein